MLRAELSRSTDVSVGVGDLEILKEALQTQQKIIYDEHDWSFMRQVWPAIPLNAGQRYYDLNDGLNFDRIERAAVRIGGRPVDFHRGISFEHYAIFDSDADVRSGPAQRWDVRWTGTSEQIEVWPIPPDTNVTQMQFEGLRELRDLVDDDDVADLDDVLIVLYTAANVLQHAEAADAALKLKQAQARLARLKGRAAAGRSDIVLGSGSKRDNPSWKATVRISGR